MPETITIEGKSARLSNGTGQDHIIEVDKFVVNLTRQTVHGWDPEPIPDNVKWLVHCAPLTVAVVELKPELRWVKWLAKDSPAPFGPTATHVERQLATPYVVVKVPLRQGKVLGRVEVFYRNEPLRGLDGDGGALCYPNLLNVSPHAYGCTTWFCTQYLAREPVAPGLAGALTAVLHHMWGGQFNASSERHEGSSTWSKAVADKIDPRVTDVERWEQESRQDPRFVLTVPWKPTGLTVRTLIEQELKANNVQAVPDSAATLGNILLKATTPAAGGAGA